MRQEKAPQASEALGYHQPARGSAHTPPEQCACSRYRGQSARIMMSGAELATAEQLMVFGHP